ncbi:MAG: helix-hairpin-helix domain-containing protein [Chthoniobacterales bacterium]
MANHPKAVNARAATVLELIPNIGLSVAEDLRLLGIRQPHQLIGKDPVKLYRALCQKTKIRQDPCVLDTFIAAVRFMEGAPARPWWHYTAERKKTYRLDPSSRGHE